MRNPSRYIAREEFSFIPMLEKRRREGHHFGPGGSLEITERRIAPLAKEGDIAMQMQVAKTYRTIATNLGVRGVLDKPRAVMYLHRAKKFATSAFLKEGRSSSLLPALAAVNIKFTYKNRTTLGYECVHTLMSCYAVWTKKVLASRILVSPLDSEVISTCHKIIMDGGNEEVRMLSMATLIELSWTDGGRKEGYRKEIEQFTAKHYEKMLSAKNPSEQDIRLVHILCRINRAVGDALTAALLAARYGLGDQLLKAQRCR